MGNNWRKFVNNNPNWLVAIVPLIPLCCLVWYMSLSIGNPKHFYNPTWSPKGDMIAFECIYITNSDVRDGFMNDGIYLYPLHDICTKDKTDGDITRVTYERRKYSPAWSLDGSKLAWISTIEKYDEEGNIFFDDEITIWTISTDYYEQYSAPEDIYFADFDEDYLEWINDDTQLAIQGSGVILNIEDGKFTFLPKIIDGIPVRYYSISPNGKYSAAVQSVDEPTSHFRFLIYDDDKLIHYSETESPIFEIPVWADNSNNVLLVTTGGNELNHWPDTLSIIDILSDELIVLPLLSVPDIYHPVWLSNDTQIIFASFDDEIHILDIKIKSEPFNLDILRHKVTDVASMGVLSPFSITKDGKMVVYSSDNNRKLEIETITK